MGPIIGIGLGVGIHDFDLIKRCVRNLLMAAGFSILNDTPSRIFCSACSCDTSCPESEK